MFTPEQALKTQMGSRIISTLSLTSALDGGQGHTTLALPSGKKADSQFT